MDFQKIFLSEVEIITFVANLHTTIPNKTLTIHMKTKLCILLFLVTWLTKAQQKKFVIDWVDEKLISLAPSSIVVVPGFNDQHFNYDRKNKQLYYTAQWKTRNYAFKGKIVSVSFQPISKQLLKNIDLSKIPHKISFSLSTRKARNISYTHIRLNPLLNDKGVIKKITSFSVDYSSSRYAKSKKRSLALPANSVLATGDWFQFYIEKSGIYKITYDFLEQLGMSPASINPKHIQIYGHGGGMLPLQNRNTLSYDPPQLAIQVHAGNDGRFDQGDYILFYGEGNNGPQNMTLPAYNTHINLYAKQTYYYITTRGMNGKRVEPMPQPSGAANHLITAYDDYQYYEKDAYSLVKVGRRWFGDRFDIERQKSYEFDFKNRVPNAPISVRVNAAATSEVATSMKILANGQQVSSLNFIPINDHAYASGDSYQGKVAVNAAKIKVQLIYNNHGVPSGTGYLDFIGIEAKRKLIAGNKQFDFHYKDASNLSGIAKFRIQNTENTTQIWDVTNPSRITNTVNSAGSSSLTFKANMGEVHRYIALSPNDFYSPKIPLTPHVNNQNLKAEMKGVDYLIITNSLLAPQARRLARHRRKKDGLQTKVVLLEDIYTEFSTGQPDVTAIRNFVYYTYHTYGKNLKYLCLFGDASVDYKNRLPGNNNRVPVYESYNSFSIGEASFPSDDFYGMLDPGEGILTMYSSGKLDLAVGRIIADSPQQAKIIVDKIVAYDDKSTAGSWHNNLVLIADDAEQGSGAAGFGLQKKLDTFGMSILQNQAFINTTKIYSDAYQQESSAGGARYPQVNKAIADAVETGALVINYLGHGGEETLAQERILTIPDIKSWNNKGKYPVFLTITCEFTKFDNPLRPTGGEFLLWQKDAGAVANIGTTRSISVSGGVEFNSALIPYLFDYKNTQISVGEAVRLAKNELSTSSKRVVFFFGDPAMKLAIPEPKINLTHINGARVTQKMDTLKALGHVTIKGQVTNNGNLLSNFDGLLYTTVFDKNIKRQTLNNDGSGVFDFMTLGEIIFRGKASVKGGEFQFDFVVPKDIDMQVGEARISFYANESKLQNERTGYNNTILVGGINKTPSKDEKGPEIQLYMNDESFVSGGITNDSPILLVKLADPNGINTASGIGHDLVAILDGNETEPYVVNDYYQTEVDDYTKGTVSYQLQDLEPGIHTLTFKAWDVYNNSSTAEIQFVVTNDEDLKISRVLNYPNPFHNYTEFWFNHNRPFEPLKVQVQVFTITGKMVWSTHQTITTQGFLSREIIWDGKDDFGQAIGKGVYIYKLTVKSTLTNDQVEKFEKLVIL